MKTSEFKTKIEVKVEKIKSIRKEIEIMYNDICHNNEMYELYSRLFPYNDDYNKVENIDEISDIYDRTIKELYLKDLQSDGGIMNRKSSYIGTLSGYLADYFYDNIFSRYESFSTESDKRFAYNFIRHHIDDVISIMSDRIEFIQPMTILDCIKEQEDLERHDVFDIKAVLFANYRCLLEHNYMVNDGVDPESIASKGYSLERVVAAYYQVAFSKALELARQGDSLIKIEYTCGHNDIVSQCNDDRFIPDTEIINLIQDRFDKFLIHIDWTGYIQVKNLPLKKSPDNYQGLLNQ